MNIDRYLHRIKYSGSKEPCLEVLKNLQMSHLLTVPFENLDIHNNRPIELSIDSIFDKVVRQNRGGFCYELNGLFYELLIALGFDARRVSARVYDEKKGYGKEFDHLAIIVRIENLDYLTDVGFGEFIFAPLVLNLGMIQQDVRGDFFIDNYKNDYFRVNMLQNSKSMPQYIFKDLRRELLDFKEMCIYHQTSPDSHFTAKRLISLATQDGRITVSGNTLIVKEHEALEESVLKNEQEFRELLRSVFYKEE